MLVDGLIIGSYTIQPVTLEFRQGSFKKRKAKPFSHKCGRFYHIFSDFRECFETVHNVQKLGGNYFHLLHVGFTSLQPYVTNTRLFSFTGSIAGVASLKKSIQHLKREINFNNYLTLLFAIRKCAQSGSSFLKGIKGCALIGSMLVKNHTLHTTAKVIMVAITPLWFISTTFSILFFVAHSKDYYETHLFQKKLNQCQSEPNKGELLKKLLKETHPSDLSKYLMTEGALVQKKIDALFGQSIIPEKKQKKVNKTYKKFQKRVQTSLDNRKWMLLGDAAFALGSWLTLFKVAGTFAKVCKDLSFTGMVINNIYKYYSSKGFLKTI